MSSVVIYYSNYWLNIKYWYSFYYHLYQMIGNVDWINNASATFWWGSTCPYNVRHKGERIHKLAYSPPQIHNLYLLVTHCRLFLKDVSSEGNLEGKFVIMNVIWFSTSHAIARLCKAERHSFLSISTVTTSYNFNDELPL